MNIVTIYAGGDTIKAGEGCEELVFTPSEEANICFSCPKKECHPGSCRRYKAQMQELKKTKK